MAFMNAAGIMFFGARRDHHDGITTLIHYRARSVGCQAGTTDGAARDGILWIPPLLWQVDSLDVSLMG
jgi:hypothetical protein